MADINKQLRQFHETIAVKRDEEKAVLAEKRDIILQKLASGIKAQRERGEPIPGYQHRNQGSYAMGTGIKPLDGDYDLDVALLFELATNEQPDPVVVKRWVHTALDGHTQEVRMREPCVTVFYSQGGEHIYHVDLAIYSAGNVDGRTHLARGRESSPPSGRLWEESDPRALIELLKSRYADTADRAQFRRVVRYLKRWKDVNFSAAGNGAPTGIALTGCAFEWFQVAKTTDRVANTSAYDDQAATLRLVLAILRAFRAAFDAGSAQLVERLAIHLPVPPGNDLFERMTAAQMRTLRERLQSLAAALESATKDPDPHTAAKTLRAVFGDDFPVPERVETGKERRKAFISSGNSA